MIFTYVFFHRYCTQDLTFSGFNVWSEDNIPISGFDITYLLLFIIARLCDVFLMVAAVKQKSDWDKTPLLALPWLIINALELCLKVVSYCFSINTRNLIL